MRNLAAVWPMVCTAPLPRLDTAVHCTQLCSMRALSVSFLFLSFLPSLVEVEAYRRPRPGPEPPERKAYARYWRSLAPVQREALAQSLIWPPAERFLQRSLTSGKRAILALEP